MAVNSAGGGGGGRKAKYTQGETEGTCGGLFSGCNREKPVMSLKIDFRGFNFCGYSLAPGGKIRGLKFL